MSPTAVRTAHPRSDLIRQRRTTRSQHRLERAARHVAATPPVTMRRSGMGKPVLQRTSSRPRRVFTVAMQNSGRAYSIPAPTIRLGWRALSGILVTGLILLLGYLLTSSQFQVEKPQITGSTRVSANDIESVLRLSQQTIFSVDPAQITRDLEKHFPELQGIGVKVELPNTVTVRFTERQPVLAWKQKDTLRWIDATGTLFMARGASPEKLVMVISADDPPMQMVAPTPGPTPEVTIAIKDEMAPQVNEPHSERMDLQILTSALLLSNQLPVKANLIFSAKEGLGWHDARGWDVYFGRTLDDLEMKISMYQAMIAQLEQKKIRPKYVNLEFLHAPFYRLEP